MAYYGPVILWCCRCLLGLVVYWSSLVGLVWLGCLLWAGGVDLGPAVLATMAGGLLSYAVTWLFGHPESKIATTRLAPDREPVQVGWVLTTLLNAALGGGVAGLLLLKLGHGPIGPWLGVTIPVWLVRAFLLQPLADLYFGWQWLRIFTGDIWPDYPNTPRPGQSGP